MYFYFFHSITITIRVSNSLDPDKAQHSVGLYLGPNCLQRLSADDKSLHAEKFFMLLSLSFSKLTFSKKKIRNSIRVSNGLEPDYDQSSVGPDLVANCLQRLSATSKERVNSDKHKML